jgi:predicted nucleic acid-binding protein
VILVDTSIWIDHLRRSNDMLLDALARQMVLAHPFVIGELAAGSIKDRASFLEFLGDLPEAVIAEDREVLRYIEQSHLHGLGIGYLDLHLFVSCRLTTGTRLWTRDRRLHALAENHGCAVSVPNNAPH